MLLCYNFYMSKLILISDYVANRKTLLSAEIATKTSPPHLVIIQVNDDFASNKYIGGKLKDAHEVNMQATLIKLDVNTSEAALLTVIAKYNKDKSVHGIIVQMPLPRHINEQIVKESIAPDKDVDGFHPLSRYKACTPFGIINYLKANNVNLIGENVLVIGRSNIVGKPAAQLFLNEHANVTIVHSRTKAADLNNFIAHAKIIIVAVGIPHFIHEQKMRKDAILVDVGINYVDGKLTGDAAPNLPIAMQTPVPGGVGLLTRLTLIENVMEAYKHGI